MGLTCNIDRTGRKIRLIGGLVGMAAGVTWIITGWPGGTIAWIGGVLLIALGAFGVFEGTIGWCAVRAMGYHTKY